MSAQESLDLWSARFESAGQQASIRANAQWHREALRWIEARNPGETFTTDDWIEALGVAPSLGISGAVIRTAQQDGLIVYVEHTRSTRLRRRGGAIARWRRV